MADNHADDIRKARLAQVDARLAALDDERATLTERRKLFAPHLPKKPSTAKKD